MRYLFTLIFGLSVTFTLGQEYDLRGPAPQKGMVITTKAVTTIKDANVEIKVGDQKVNLTQTMKIENEEKQEILEVMGRIVTKCQTQIVKDKVKVSMNGGGEDKSGDLEGETIITERTKDGQWKHSLVDGKPNEEQKKDLDKRNGPENDDDAYPDKKVPVGHTWTVDAAKMKSLTGNSFTDVKGKVNQKFVKVEKVDGVECAMIEFSGTITGKMKDDMGTPDVSMTLTATSWRSLSTGVEMKSSMKGKIKISGKIKLDTEEVDMVMEGPIEGTQSAKVK